MFARDIRFLSNSIIMIAMAAILTLPPLSTSAAPDVRFYINVTTTADEFDLTGSGSGCSLREAIKSTNDGTDFGGCNRFFGLGSGPLVIQVPAGTYELTLTGSGEDLDATGDLDILNYMVIGALDPTPPVIQGGTGFGDRLFHIQPTATVPNPVVIFNSLTLSKGQATDPLGSGVLINLNASLTMNNCQVESNSFPGGGGYGGGIYNNGTLTINSSVINSNSAGVSGGGIYNIGTVTLNDSTLNGNAAVSDGGGIWNAAGVGVVIMNNGLLNGNFSNQGGGIYSTHGTVTLNNVIVSNNFTLSGANHDGGGIYLLSSVANLTGGVIHDNISGANGGGIFIQESTANLTDVVLKLNRANQGNGGGIFIGTTTMTSSTGNLTMNGGSLSGNQAGGGAGIYENITSGSVHITSLKVSGNSATGSGGAIYNQNGLLTIESSTLDRNAAGFFGGGIFTSSSTSSATLTNVTISGNSAVSAGGGIYRSLGAVTLTNVTISGNSSVSGGGILGTAILYNTIMANSPTGGNCSLPLGGVNNLSDDATCDFGLGRDSVTMLLLPLGYNGGPTQTFVPLPASPAIDAGSDASCPTADQRGQTRGVGAHCDVGSVERQTLDYPLVFEPLILR